MAAAVINAARDLLTDLEHTDIEAALPAEFDPSSSPSPHATPTTAVTPTASDPELMGQLARLQDRY